MAIVDASESAPSPWPRRLMVAGGGLLSLGLLLLFIAASALQADLTLEGIAEDISLDDTTTLTLATGCWNVYAVGGDDASLSLEIDGPIREGTTARPSLEAITLEPCNDGEPNSFPLNSGGSEGSLAGGGFRINETGTYTMSARCSGDACPDSVHILTVPMINAALATEPLLISAFAVCGLSVLLLPVGVVLQFMEQRSASGRVMMVHPDSTAGSTSYPEWDKGAPSDATHASQQEVPVGPLDKMLTTDQVFLLAHGGLDMGPAQPEVPSPFPTMSTPDARPAPIESQPAPEETAPTGGDWAAWDEG